MKHDRTLVILAAVAALLAAFIWWDRRKPTTDERNRQGDHLIPGFARTAATEIAVERGGAVTTLRHEANGWWVAGPPRRRADDDAVESLLAVLEFGRVERRIAHVDAATKTKLGLDAPRATIKVAGHVLRIGGDDPSRGVYVQRDGDPDALVVERRLAETADLDPRLWISTRPTLTDPSEAKSIATAEWTLERAAGWRVTKPAVTRAADAKVDALIQSLQRARGKLVDNCSFTDGVALTLDGVPQARAQQELVARSDGACLQFRPSDLNLVAAPVATYYERRLFPMRLDDIVAADLGPLSLRREAGAWRITAPLAAAAPASDEAVRAALEPLLAAEARSFSAAPVAAGTKVRLATRDDDVTVTLDGARARRAGETVTLDLATAPSVTLDVTRLRRAAGDLGATPF